jgi:hypothetical protein
MGGWHTVRQGECLASLAKLYGFPDYKKIYNDPNNSDFRELRRNPNIIYPGDSIYIPDREPRIQNCGTDKKHRFVLHVPKVLLSVVVKDEDIPVDSAPFVLILGNGEKISGTTGSDGLVECAIPPDLEQAVLEVQVTRNQSKSILQRWMLRLGHLDPAEEVAGIQARLNNLRFDCGRVDGVAGPKTEAAVRSFQEWAGLEIDGIAGPKTQKKLKQEHGC